MPSGLRGSNSKTGCRWASATNSARDRALRRDQVAPTVVLSTGVLCSRPGRRPRVGVLRVRVQESVQPDRHDLPGQTEPVLESTAFDPPPTPLGQHDPMIVHLVTVGTLPITDTGAANADAVMPSKIFGSVASCSARLEPPSIAR